MLRGVPGWRARKGGYFSKNQVMQSPLCQSLLFASSIQLLPLTGPVRLAAIARYLCSPGKISELGGLQSGFSRERLANVEAEKGISLAWLTALVIWAGRGKAYRSLQTAIAPMKETSKRGIKLVVTASPHTTPTVHTMWT